MGRGSWRGRVVEGRLHGHIVEVRASGEPIPIYVIAVRSSDRSRDASIDFAVGEEALRAHFMEREMRVLWEHSREASCALLGEERRETRLGVHRRALWRPRSLESNRPSATKRSRETSSEAQEMT